jgi:nicotinamidase-related amidase
MATTNKGKVLLVMDIQQGIISRFPNATEYLSRVATTIDSARAKSIPIIYVTVQFRRGYPEISKRNKGISGAMAMAGNAFEEGKPGVQIPAEIAPTTETDILVSKRRVSAFTGSDLDVVLRGLEAETLVLAGVSTSGVVLSTVRQAADMDYGVTVLEDLCLDNDPEVHRVLVEKVFPRQADVVSSEKWVESL